MTNKYPNEYFPKIEYWTAQLVEAVKNEDIYDIDHAHRKLDYFVQKQFDLKVAEDRAYEDQAHSAFYANNL